MKSLNELLTILLLLFGSCHHCLSSLPFLRISQDFHANHYSTFDLRDAAKVESSLTRARASIRKAALMPSSTFSNIYRNAPAFYRSYAEMEKRFKIFVYPEGEPPLAHWGPCKSIYSTEGRFIQQLELPGAPFVTSNPEKAQVFFLPFSVTMMVEFIYRHETYEIPEVRLFVKDYIDRVGRKYPYWNRSLGADHFMLSCHDWGPITSLANPFLYNNSIRVLCNANTSEGFNPTKDASLPEMNLITDGYSSHHMFGGRPPLERPILAFFAGGDHGVVRSLLFKHWINGSDPDIQVHQYLPKGRKHKSYLNYMNNTKFCLCPSGYEVASPRIVEAIYSGCVPVIISDHYVLPFSDVLSWDTFSVFVPPPEIPNLKNILQSIPTETYVKLHDKVVEVQKHFLINQPPKKYDMFHMIIHSVWLRRLNIIVQK
ncbi:hypothetical protein SUGI_0841360 [Cryptomeria japonica]|uniref:probable glycosyltransferase At5g03795 n=1 Tax=Cryptomeria japonica TaxID=3369 RepID=UPI002414ABFF|nr:probable glycosyltransferase At5g03795 [Cryptomeria japonica]GLJ40717.1 hypothetical protein SUGI_0841360 [Cryptomeria japonica]